MNWFENLDTYVVSGCWSDLTVTLLEPGTVWKACVVWKYYPQDFSSPEYKKAWEANKNKPYFVVEEAQGRVVYIETATKAGVLRFVDSMVHSVEFSDVFRQHDDLGLLRTMEFTPISTEKLCSGDFIKELGQGFYGSGKIFLKSFHADDAALAKVKSMSTHFYPNHPSVLAYFLASNPTLQAGLENLHPRDTNPDLIDSESLEYFGLLACLLKVLCNVLGGFRVGARLPGPEDIQMIVTFLEELLGDKALGSVSCMCDTAWTGFFHDSAWDYTFIIISPDEGNVHVLYTTDVD